MSRPDIPGIRSARTAPFDSVSGPGSPSRAVSLTLGWSVLLRSLTLLPALTPLGPHVIAVATPKPLLIAAGIVCWEGVERAARATGARRLRLFGIRRTMAARHATAPPQDLPSISPMDFMFRSNLTRATRAPPAHAPFLTLTDALHDAEEGYLASSGWWTFACSTAKRESQNELCRNARVR